MRRRITRAIVGVTAFVVMALGIPLAIVAQQSILDSEVVELQAAAARTLAEITLPIDPAALDRLRLEPDAPPPFTVYDTEGQLVFGDGPLNGDALVAKAVAGVTASSTDGQIVVATPISAADERVQGVLRLSESLSGADSRVRRAWLVMALTGAAAVGAAWLIGRRLAGRLSRPVTDLAVTADRLGHGETVAIHEPTGIAEIDLLGDALADSSRRINDALARERRFSADVSHQLRTPIAGLRLRLEAASESGGPLDSGAALADLVRLEDTVTHLLSFARDAMPERASSSLRAGITAAIERWHDRVASSARTIVDATDADDTDTAAVRASASSVDQVLDVLIDNALRHGVGDIVLAARHIGAGAGAAIDVRDAGHLAIDGDRIFARGVGAGSGIGLALARSISEAEGGRLIVTSRDPTTFSLVLLATSE
jgi:signal transduction histidine kinase